VRRRLRVTIAAILALVPLVGLHAHPHVFISSLVAVDFKEASLERVSVAWTFDELFSQMILADYHPDAKGAFAEAEALALKKGAFDNLRNYHYFLAFYLGGKRIALPPIEDFRPSVRDGRLIYAFSLPLRLPIAAETLELRITIYDDTYYVAFDKMSPSDVAIQGGDSIDATVSIEKTKVKAEWPGQFMPDQIVLRMKRK